MRKMERPYFIKKVLYKIQLFWIFISLFILLYKHDLHKFQINLCIGRIIYLHFILLNLLYGCNGLT